MFSNDPTYPLFPICAFLGFVLSLVPLPWHVQAWNSGTCAYMLWTATACLLSFVNAIVWRGNALNVAPIWCDISSKLLLGVSIGIPASGLCISRRLYKISAMKCVSITRQDKIRAICIDLAIAVGIPVLVMILHVVVQPHRFDILEDVGCYAAIYITLPAYFLFFMWPLVLGFFSFIFSALCLRAFYIRRLQFAQILARNKSLNTSRYMRLMLLAIIDMCCTIPLGALSIYLSSHGITLSPWISWEDTHYDFGRVELIPALIWRSDATYQSSVELTRWLPVICAFLFFGLFGFANEAKRYYSERYAVIAKKLGHVSSPKLRGFQLAHPKWDNKKDAGSLPVYMPKAANSAFASAEKMKMKDTFASSTAADSSMSFDAEKGIPLPSSPATTAPPEYEYPGRDMHDLSLHVIPPSPPSSGPSSPTTTSSSRRSSTEIEHREFSFQRLPSRSILAGPSSSSLHSQSLASLRAPSTPARHHTPQHSRSHSSLHSLATTLASTTSGRDVIYIYDAYADAPSPLPFSNFDPAGQEPSEAETRQPRRAATPLPPLFTRRERSPPPVRVFVETERDADHP
ncbi:pheromone A receptor-domain-containing protein [Schizophyllum amplum]|uniref:Pheromone A receptor-domain-containing protein n=1 Tax=Schizophyllum amplum TaxID=97359 RepID=A0A550BVX1_9AGAR|nr:pheromone A receptor-domain-containing protein [Auriculariopsis ampla]